MAATITPNISYFLKLKYIFKYDTIAVFRPAVRHLRKGSSRYDRLQLYSEYGTRIVAFSQASAVQ